MSSTLEPQCPVCVYTVLFRHSIECRSTALRTHSHCSYACKTKENRLKIDVKIHVGSCSRVYSVTETSQYAASVDIWIH